MNFYGVLYLKIETCLRETACPKKPAIYQMKSMIYGCASVFAITIFIRRLCPARQSHRIVPGVSPMHERGVVL